MRFQMELFKELLVAIECRVKFSVDGVDGQQSFNLSSDIQISELVEALTKTERYKVDDVKYCIALLYHLDYIKVSEGKITNVAPKGYKLILSVLHGLNCQY